MTNEVLLNLETIIEADTEKFVKDFLAVEFVEKFPKQKIESINKAPNIKLDKFRTDIMFSK